MSQEARVRKRIPTSCKRCHRRKQRCVGFPTCSSCEVAGQPCTRAETAPSWHHAMSKGALVRRIEMLEAQLAERQPGDERLTPASGTVHHASSPKENIISLTAIMSSDNPQENQSYFGPSSGLSMAKSLDWFIHDTVLTRSIPVSASIMAPTVEPFDQTVLHRAKPPGDEEGSRLLDAYFSKTHIRFPFLDRAQILKLHAERYQSLEDSPEGSYRQFKLFMVYAIGATVLQMTQNHNTTTTSPSPSPPSTYLTTALSFESSLRDSFSLAGLEAIMLLVMYHLRLSSPSKVWYMLGLAMRISIDLGLHRELHYRNIGRDEAQRRRRLFWSVYLVERYISWSLGRPFNIAEEEIDAGIPADLGDHLADDDVVVANSIQSPPDPHSQGNCLRRFIACIRLSRIASVVHTRIYRVDRDISTLLPEIDPLMNDLQQFEKQLPHLAPDDDDFVRMHLNNSVRVVLQPFLAILPSADSRIQTCLAASGRMCQLFKKSRQTDSSAGHSFLLANSIFMAGLTMCFCLFRSPSLWSITVANDIRACSSAMFFMSERNLSLSKYRDSLETIINRVMEFVDQNQEATTTRPSFDFFASVVQAGGSGIPSIDSEPWSDLGDWFGLQNTFGVHADDL
ncbi:uncharacterized protein BHQ10_005394 [Talaromyces amestolkiae]|uniref:Zn(2)-C6 fungal-type domain-containing protein n=1 Tax=Talaromyces amestolkiae TaxID=1196081 RepID=A0A364L0P6_TALAM|nr:uncharacterized protein BHQ10_005394 [Talaromyces amestolkiae]RAO69382.1 hypothetical protein BHQ10_005394 [Talaromyces amestolkiae]